MNNHDLTTWDLPLGQPAELELQSDWGNLSIVPVEPDARPRIDLSRATADKIDVHIEQVGNTVRVVFEPRPSFNWFSGWECRATLYVPRDVRAHVQTNAGSVTVRDLQGCELGIKASAGRIDLNNVHGLLHLAADAGSVTGDNVGGYFDVQTQAGSVRLGVSELQPGEHRFRATMGSVRLELARGLDVCIETKSSLGSVRANYPSNASAPARLLLSTEMGSLRVDEGSLAPQPQARPVTADTPAPASEASDGGELERILKMVESGELSASDADELLRAMGRV